MEGETARTRGGVSAVASCLGWLRVRGVTACMGAGWGGLQGCPYSAGQRWGIKPARGGVQEGTNEGKWASVM